VAAGERAQEKGRKVPHFASQDRESQSRLKTPRRSSQPRSGQGANRPISSEGQFCPPPIPISGDQLRGAAVLAKSIIDAELASYELRDLILALRKAIDELWEIVKVQGDLLIELGEKAEERRWLAHRIRQAERESARLRVPIWFWRPPEAGVSIQEALAHRIQWMRDEGYLVDDRFSLAREYFESIDASGAVSDEEIAQMI